MIETIGLDKKIKQKVLLRFINEIFSGREILTLSTKNKKYILSDGKSMKKIKTIPKGFTGFGINFFYNNKQEFKTTLMFYRTPKELTSERELIIAYKLSEKFKCRAIINSGNKKISNNPYLSLVISESNFFEADTKNSAWGGDGSERVRIIKQIDFEMYDFNSIQNILTYKETKNVEKKRKPIMDILKEEKKKIIWNARKLLDMILYFTYIEPERNNWAPHKLYHDRKRIRLLRILSLLKAFKIENDEGEINFIDFIDGEAFNYCELKDYKTLMPILEEYAQKSEDSVSLSDVQDFFYHLLTYRISVEKTLRLYDYPFETGFIGHYAGTSLVIDQIKKTKDLNHHIDLLLIEMIDPFNKDFTEFELIMNYEFPTEDLNKIDNDFWEDI